MGKLTEAWKRRKEQVIEKVAPSQIITPAGNIVDDEDLRTIDEIIGPAETGVPIPEPQLPA